MNKKWETGDKVGFVAYPGELEEFFVSGIISREDEDGRYWVENEKAEWAGIEGERLISTEFTRYYSVRSALKKNHFRIFAEWPSNWKKRPIS